MSDIEFLQQEEQNLQILHQYLVEQLSLPQHENNFNDPYLNSSNSLEKKFPFDCMVMDQRSVDYFEDSKSNHLVFQLSQQYENHDTLIIQPNQRERNTQKQKKVAALKPKKSNNKMLRQLNSYFKRQKPKTDSNLIIKKYKQSARHNFPKFVCGQFKNIQRLQHNELKKRKGKYRADLKYLYSQFFWGEMKQSSSLKTIKRYLTSPSDGQEKDKIYAKFKLYLQSNNQKYQFLDIYVLQAEARRLILSQKHELLEEAQGRQMEEVQEYVKYLRMILGNLEKDNVKLNHKNQR